jgi:cytidylate kinase
VIDPISDKNGFVVTIDGPGGSGKGTLALAIARHFGFNLLDSGAIYRLLALKALRESVDLDDEEALLGLLDNFDIRFDSPSETGDQLSIAFLDNQDVSDELRRETTGDAASKVARHARLREGLLAVQQAFFKPPGLVADGRDMGTVVFPEARHKFYLYASVEIRAQRRYKQLINMGLSANIAQLQTDISERDERDRNRKASPLVPAEDALVVDSSLLDLNQVIKLVLSHIEETN